jgi:uncharacterized protein YodC (DUF2158 family)
MQEEIKAGDCVELKFITTEFKMVVDEIFMYRGDNRAVCKWYNSESKKFEKEAFSVNALKKCEGT